MLGVVLSAAVVLPNLTGAEQPQIVAGRKSGRAVDRPEALLPVPFDDPARVVGVVDGDCRMCHAAEVSAWKHTAHARSDERLYEPHARDYAAAVGIAPDELRTDSLCLRCHTTQAVDRYGRVRPISGVSCESCHGAAGGNPGWLNPHAVYGPNGTTVDRETPEHLARRIAFCESQGMIRPAHIYELAQRCLSCHIVDVPELVAAGHSSGSFGFEFEAWSNGEIRHNFHQNPQHNAPAPSLLMAREGVAPQHRRRVKFVAGLLADLEVTLRSRAYATKPGHADYAAELAERAESVLDRLAAMNTAETQAAVTLVRPLMRDMKKIAGTDPHIIRNTARQVGQLGRAFVDAHDGSRLEAVDRLLANSPSVGEPFQPE